MRRQVFSEFAHTAREIIYTESKIDFRDCLIEVQVEGFQTQFHFQVQPGGTCVAGKAQSCRSFLSVSDRNRNLDTRMKKIKYGMDIQLNDVKKIKKEKTETGAPGARISGIK